MDIKLYFLGQYDAYLLDCKNPLEEFVSRKNSELELSISIGTTVITLKSKDETYEIS